MEASARNQIAQMTTPSTTPWLTERIAACVHRARERQGSVLLRVHVTLPTVDPWHLLPVLAPHQPIFAWDQFQRAGLRFVAWGQLATHTLTLDGSDGYELAQRWCGELLEQVVDIAYTPEAQPAVDVPIAVGGFAFDPMMSAQRQGWPEWPVGLFSVPDIVIYQRSRTDAEKSAIQPHTAAETALVLTSVISETTQTAAALDSILARVQRVAHVVADVLNHHNPDTAANPDAALSPCGSVTIRSLEDEAQWCARVAAASAAVADGALDKVVLARAAECELPTGSRFDRMAVLEALRQAHPESICFAVSQTDGHCFLGATPEILVDVSGRTVRTHALAGTAPRGADAASDAALGEALVCSPKNAGEHQIVAQAVESLLAPLCAELHRPAVPQLHRLRRVQHLETPFSGVLRRAGGIVGLVERLHPTPSVGGWPRDAARAWLRAHEGLDRGWYAAPVGWMTAAGDGAFVVAIRSVLLGERTARAFTGAGIVAASDPHAEWLETELKLRTVLEALRIERPACDGGRAHSSVVA